MRTLLRLTLMVALSAPALAFAQVPPGGPEIPVNQVTSGDQHSPSVAVEADGGYVVAWTSAASTIAARRFDAGGAPRGNEFTVNVLPAGPYSRPSVAAHPSGGFVVAWHAPDGSGQGIFARRFDAAGSPTTGEIRVNLDATGDQATPRISGGPLGYAVVWQNGSAVVVVGRLLGAAGNPIGVEIPVGVGVTPAVTWSGNGLAFAWAAEHGGFVWLRLFDGGGAPLGAAQMVNGANPPMPCAPSCSGTYHRRSVGVAAAANGTLTVTWDLEGSASTGGLAPAALWYEQFGSYVRRYHSGGGALGPEVRVNAFTAGSQSGPRVAVAPGGGSFVSWSSSPVEEGCLCSQPSEPPPAPQDGSGAGVYAHLFDANGNTIGPGEFRVNATTAGDQWNGAVAATESSLFAVFHMPDGSGTGLHARHFPFTFARAFAPARLEVDPTDEPQSDGNQVLESGEVVVVAPAWRNTAGETALGSTAANFGGLAGPSYWIADAFAYFGLVPNGVTRSCLDTFNCFRLGVFGARPATHWDAYFTESPSPAYLFPPRARTLHIGESFGDVPRSSPFYRFVETVFHHTVMTRCATASFCPALPVTRDAMAFHVVRAASPALVPQNCVAGSELFPDVPASALYCPYVEELARRGVVGGCGGGLYCPAQGVSREAMAVFLLLTREGTGYVPPACTTPVFNDVPASSPFCRWIEELARRGIVGGCGGGAYCPAAPVSREQMAVFLTGSFALLLYAP